MEKKIDHRHHYIIVLDTETANTFTDESGKLDISQALVYDIGWSVLDTKGNVYEERSFVNREVFLDKYNLMQSAYYGDKIPQYIEDLIAGTRTLATLAEIRTQFLADLEFYGVTEVAAHNARFDCSALNSTMRQLTPLRYFLPYGIEWWDTLKMARDVILKQPTYRLFCEQNNLFTKNGRLSATAENLYRYITLNPDFVESHTGLEDVQIERAILLYCLRRHKKMRKKLWENP